MVPLTPFLQGIQTGAMVLALFLFSGALYGLRTRADFAWSGPALKLPKFLDQNKEDKRRLRRMAFRSRLEFFSETNRLAGEGQIINISENGICFSSKADLHFGDRIQARLATPYNGMKRVIGRIIWTRSRLFVTRYGVRIIPPNLSNQ